VIGSSDISVANPNATVDGIVYGLPIDGYWNLQGFAHELGHIAGAEHTHCTGLTPDEKTAYGVTRDFVDECFIESQAGCFAGPSPGVPPEKGTIMSYCYLQTRLFGYPQSRYLFGEAGKTSQKMLEVLTRDIDYAVPTGTFAVGSNLSCASGQTASADGGCGADCTYSWTISGGSIQGSAATSSISFTPSAASVTLALSITDPKGCKITTTVATTSQCANTLGAPASVIATAGSSSSVNLSWTAVTGAATYDVERSADRVVYAVIGTPAATVFADSTAAANTSYLYRVRARDAGTNTGPYGPLDFATTVIFIDDPVTAGSSVVNIVHMTELRTAVNAMRVLAQLGPFTFTDTIGTLVPVRKMHIDELRANLDAARVAIGWNAGDYTDPVITAMSTTVKAAHINELRNYVK
jgi:hypothetical protein